MKIPIWILLIEPKKRVTTMLAAGIDMGTRNLAITQINAQKSNERVKMRVSDTCMADRSGLVHDMKCVDAAAFATLLPDVDLVFAERYQPRPGRGGHTTAECVNVMLGIICHHYALRGVPVVLYTAATWKNAFNATNASLNCLYEDLQGVAIHQVDSMLIAMYGLCKHFGVKPFYMIRSHTDEQKIIRALVKNDKSR